jgi:type VI secretion system protein ImpF
MAKKASERTVRASVLDRLIDRDPRTPTDPTVGRAASEARYRTAVLRDVEWLLNTRRTIVTASPELEEVRTSVYHYGVPDVTSLSADSQDSRRFLLRQVEEAIRHFEPRLTDVRVRLVDEEGGTGSRGRRSVRLRVEATLRMDPNPERIVFDTLLETVSGAFVVKE